MKTTPRALLRLWGFTVVLSMLVLVYGAAILSGPFQG
jgi:hypothetical protein